MPPPPEGMIDDGPAFVNNTEHIVPDVPVETKPKPTPPPAPVRSDVAEEKPPVVAAVTNENDQQYIDKT